MKQISRNKDQGNFLIKYLKSLCHAIDGIIYSIKYEHNMIIIILATIVTSYAGIYYKISTEEWLFCIAIIGIIIGTELINTSIEAVVDLVSLKNNQLAKIAKDTASSATLVLSIAAFIGALIIFLPKIIS